MNVMTMSSWAVSNVNADAKMESKRCVSTIYFNKQVRKHPMCVYPPIHPWLYYFTPLPLSSSHQPPALSALPKVKVQHIVMASLPPSEIYASLRVGPQIPTVMLWICMNMCQSSLTVWFKRMDFYIEPLPLQSGNNRHPQNKYTAKSTLVLGKQIE